MTTIAYNAKTYKVGFIMSPKATNDDMNAAAEAIGKNAFVEELDAMKLTELVKVYNVTAGAELKKFANKTTAVERTTKALQDAEVPTYESGAAPAPSGPATRNNSAGIAKSWKDKNVRKARTTRHSVTVKGERYRSVKQAFEVLGLPLSSHIAFRMQLKAAGKKVFEHEGEKFRFTAHENES